jgi:ABC-2 type transport system permease protein
MMLPLFVTLETALISNLEHVQHNWKLLYVQPVPRWAIYAAKQLTNLALIAASMAILIGLMFAGGLLLYSIFPQYNFTDPFPLGWTLKLSGLVFVSAWLIISIHMWISARWQSFVVACGAGITATVVAVFAFGSDYARWYPWTIPGIIAMEASSGPELTSMLTIGIAGGLLACLLGGWDVGRREIL